LVSYNEGLDSEKLAPNLVQRWITFSSPTNLLQWTSTIYMHYLLQLLWNFHVLFIKNKLPYNKS